VVPSASPEATCATIQDAGCDLTNTIGTTVTWAGPVVILAWLVLFAVLVALGFWYGVRWERRRARRT
jgi:hypothetical protein